MQCETGLVSLTGTPAEPAKVGTSIADIAAGMYAFSGILTALYQRERTGEGADLHIAMIDALGEWVVQPATFAASTGSSAMRSGARHPTIAPYGPFPCHDGAVFLAVQNDREWMNLCKELLRDDAPATDLRFKHNPDRVAHRDELELLLSEVTATMPVSQLEARLDNAGIANARMRDAADLLTHPQLVARGRWKVTTTPGGRLAPALLPPIQLSGDKPVIGPVPALGEHTEAVLAELGMTHG